MTKPLWSFFAHLRKKHSPQGEQSAGYHPPEQETAPMQSWLENALLMALTIAISSNEENLNDNADKVADKIVEAVKDTDTPLDDVGVDRLAKLLRRVADRVDAGLQTNQDAPSA